MNDLEHFEELLEVLRRAGVDEYQYGALRLKFFRPDAVILPVGTEDEEPQERAPAPATPYHNRHLFAGGEPPKFPGKE